MPPSFISARIAREDIYKSAQLAKACRRSIIEMLQKSQSGHTGSSLGCIDYLSLLYTTRIIFTGEPVVISNGHIAPAVYALLAELGWVSKKELLSSFRSVSSIFEGHVSRTVRGVSFGTGPLGIGVSAAAGFALSEKIKGSEKSVFALVGDGESQEGQVYEMMNFASKYHLDNLVVFMDRNGVQLSSSVASIMPISPKEQWSAAGWRVIETDGNNMRNMAGALTKALKKNGQPTLLLAHTIMGKGVSFIEKEGKRYSAMWHGKAPTNEEAARALLELPITQKETQAIEAIKKNIRVRPAQPTFFEGGKLDKRMKGGIPIVYTAGKSVSCRTAYGNALLSLAKANRTIVALTADLAESVKTDLVRDAYPSRHIECGVAEQHMVTTAGAMSLSGFVPFCSTYGAFMTSRAKDQARVNDINRTNVKMVATHCGLSVGKDGPTHQAIDDIGSMLGLLHTQVMEPCDANHTDRMIRYAATHLGNMYIRMGRHNLPILTKEDGSPFYDKEYVYQYGSCDILREGKDVTIATSGSMVEEALKARQQLQKKGIEAEIVIVSSAKEFDAPLFSSIEKTKAIVTVEDHVPHSGFASQLLRVLVEKGELPKHVFTLGVTHYQTSGEPIELYERAGISAKYIVKAAEKVVREK